MRRLIAPLGCRAVSAVEFAIWAPLLALILMATADLGNQVQASIRLEHAARSGAQLAIASPGDEAAIRNAVQLSWPALTAAEVSVSCSCGATAQACAAPCAAPQIRTISITATRSLSPLLLPGANRSRGNATVRLG